MIASIVLLFVAAGITVASVVYGFGGLLPLMLFVSALTALYLGAGLLMRRGLSDPLRA